MITFIVFYSKIQQLKTDENWVLTGIGRQINVSMTLYYIPLQLRKKNIR